MEELMAAQSIPYPETFSEGRSSPIRDATPLMIQFAESPAPPTKESPTIHMLTRSTCGPSSGWDDSDV